jgi:hypothetical protein
VKSLDRHTAAAEQLDLLEQLMAAPAPSAARVAEAARNAASAAEELVEQLERQSWNRNRLHQLLRDLATAPGSMQLELSAASYRTLALGSVLDAAIRDDVQSRRQESASVDRVRQALERLYNDVDDPAQYDPPAFARDLEQMRSAIEQWLGGPP